MKKIAVVGAGNVGAHIISYGIARDLPVEFLLVDLDEELEKAQVLDLKDSLLFSKRTRVDGANFGDSRLSDADIIVITAGANQKDGETRCDLLGKNAKILSSIASSLGKLKESAIVVLVTNPVDVLTHLAKLFFDLPGNQIIGTGTLLDSARLRWRMSEISDTNIKEMTGYVMGEHGDSEFVAWSTVKRADLLDQKQKDAIEEAVMREAYDIIGGKGATYFGIGAATVNLLDAIVHDSSEIYPVSVSLDGEYGLHDIALGVPCKITAQGVEKVVEVDLTDEEAQKLQASAEKLSELYRSCPVKNN